jgi:D-tyrosyl-tRNA(Tyr) deacylase
MRIILQRVSKAQCVVNNEVTGKIDKGYLLLVGFKNGDDESILKKAAQKIINLRIFEDQLGKMNLSIKQVEGKILSISQFTLYANTNEGNRPSFVEALNPDDANILYQKFNELLKTYDIEVQTGIFRSHMDISLVNDGPVTIAFDF